MKRKTEILLLGLLGFLLSGCGATLKTYVKPETPWGTLSRFAVAPFNQPSENPVERQLVTQLFAEELRRNGFSEVTEVPLDSPVGTSVVDVKTVGKTYGVDAIFSGSLDSTYGTVVHVRLQDVATEEILWSSTYTLGMRGEFFSLKTQQQHFQRAFQRLVRELVKARSVGSSS